MDSPTVLQDHQGPLGYVDFVVSLSLFWDRVPFYSGKDSLRFTWQKAL
jgi:hypothetical protein